MASQNYLQKEQPVLLQSQKTMNNQQVPFLNGNEEIADLIHRSDFFLSQMGERGFEDTKTQAFSVKHTEYNNQKLLTPLQVHILNGQEVSLQSLVSNTKKHRNHHQMIRMKSVL